MLVETVQEDLTSHLHFALFPLLMLLWVHARSASSHLRRDLGSRVSCPWSQSWQHALHVVACYIGIVSPVSQIQHCSGERAIVIVDQV